MEPEVTSRPSTRVQLPSRGILYAGRLPEGWVELCPMTTREEKILLSQQPDRAALLDRIIERCLPTKDVPLSEMLVSDRFFLLLMLRNITYGPTYRIHVSCPQCKVVVFQDIQLPDGLTLRVLTDADTEPFFVDLPMSGKKLGLRLLRVEDEQEIRRFVRQTAMTGRTAAEGDPSYIYRLARHVVSIDEQKVTTVQAVRFCENMIGGDSARMRHAVEESECGVTLTLKHTCSACGAAFEELLPFSDEFFRPSIFSTREPGPSEGADAGTPE